MSTKKVTKKDPKAIEEAAKKEYDVFMATWVKKYGCRLNPVFALSHAKISLSHTEIIYHPE